jgi:hypothetical protein
MHSSWAYVELREIRPSFGVPRCFVSPNQAKCQGRENHSHGTNRAGMKSRCNKRDFRHSEKATYAAGRIVTGVTHRRSGPDITTRNFIGCFTPGHCVGFELAWGELPQMTHARILISMRIEEQIYLPKRQMLANRHIVGRTTLPRLPGFDGNWVRQCYRFSAVCRGKSPHRRCAV